MKTILYATDYSSNSIAALKYAYALSSKLKAKLLAVHVFDYPTLLDIFNLKGEDPFPDIERDAFKKHHGKLADFCRNALGLDLQKANIHIEAIENKSVVKGIVSRAREADAFLLVTGMQGISAAREIILGHITKALLKKSPCPVLAIPAEASHTRMETMVYASDFEEEDLGALDRLTEIAKPFNAMIRVVHIVPPEDMVGEAQRKEMEDRIRKHIKYDRFELDITYSDDAFEALRIYLGKVSADLVAMLERDDKSFAAQLFHRDLVKKMESYGKVPLLSFNARHYGIFHLK